MPVFSFRGSGRMIRSGAGGPQVGLGRRSVRYLVNGVGDRTLVGGKDHAPDADDPRGAAGDFVRGWGIGPIERDTTTVRMTGGPEARQLYGQYFRPYALLDKSPGGSILRYTSLIHLEDPYAPIESGCS